MLKEHINYGGLPTVNQIKSNQISSESNAGSFCSCDSPSLFIGYKENRRKVGDPVVPSSCPFYPLSAELHFLIPILNPPNTQTYTLRMCSETFWPFVKGIALSTFLTMQKENIFKKIYIHALFKLLVQMLHVVLDPCSLCFLFINEENL